MANHLPAVLVVDDFQTMRRIIATVLREFGFRDIYEAEHGQAALAVLQSKPIGLVLSDWNMPVMDGISLVRAIRASEAHKALPVMMITAEAKENNVREAIQAGANGYVLKPFTTATIGRVVSKLFPNSLGCN